MPRRPSVRLRSALLVALACLPATAGAVIAPPHLAGRPVWEASHSVHLRSQPDLVMDVAPAATRAAWRAFQAQHGTAWHAAFDRDTGIARRVWGEGIAVPLGSKNAAAADYGARSVLTEHLALLAPGTRFDEFVPLANDWDPQSQLRTVTYGQTRGGVPVLGGQISVRIKHDRVIVLASEATPAPIRPPSIKVSADTAKAAAKAFIAADLGGSPTVGLVDGPFILPLIAQGGSTSMIGVLRVRVDLLRPRGSWDVFIDVTSGAAVARRQRLAFASGTVLGHAPIRYAGSDRQDYPLRDLSVSVDGQGLLTDLLGTLSWAGAGAATIQMTGPLINVTNSSGANFSEGSALTDGGAKIVDHNDVEFDDAQISAYVHARIAKAYTKGIVPTMAWLDESINVETNIDDVCNAFSDGVDIHFFRQDANCSNTARLADVVYHEFGHSFHFHAVIPGAGQAEGGLGEGQADYLAATITNDHGMGRGFFFAGPGVISPDPLRDVLNEAHWPEDVSDDPHVTGLIYAGAMWDLRTTLIADLGEAVGHPLADQLYYQSLRRATDIPTTYPEILAADDDNGNLADGTPHFCAILNAFGRHGLAEGAGELSVASPILDGTTLHAAITANSGQCPAPNVTGATLFWQLRADPSQSGQVPVTVSASDLTVALPSVPDGQVLQYKLVIDLDNGTQAHRPANRADPFYELYVGPVHELYCTDFEGTALPDGWTNAQDHDWEWGNAVGGGNDPATAYSGTKVLGTLIGANYRHNRIADMKLPPVDTQGYQEVRLQYRRWLSVEDGTFDQAEILNAGLVSWQNLISAEGTTTHNDNEWRFHDVDLSSGITDGKVNVTFRLASDDGFQTGGWTIDDVCVVGVGTPGPLPDAGPSDGDAGPVNPGDGDGGGCGCTVGGSAQGGAAAGGLALLALGAFLIRRRRR